MRQIPVVVGELKETCWCRVRVCRTMYVARERAETGHTQRQCRIRIYTARADRRTTMIWMNACDNTGAATNVTSNSNEISTGQSDTSDERRRHDDSVIEIQQTLWPPHLSCCCGVGHISLSHRNGALPHISAAQRHHSFLLCLLPHAHRRSLTSFNTAPLLAVARSAVMHPLADCTRVP